MYKKLETLIVPERKLRLLSEANHRVFSEAVWATQHTW